MLRRRFLLLSALASGIGAVNLAQAFDLGKMIDAGKDLAAAESLSDAELKAYFDQLAAQQDRENKVASASSPLGQRLAKLTRGLNQYKGLKLDFKVYETPEVNAFAMANGSIRLYSGLMDQFTDDEVHYVIGHEIGHVQAGHTKKRIQMALRTNAAMTAISASGDSKAARLADSQLGELFKEVILAQHSQSNENEADDRAMQFMKSRKYDPKACVTALTKLDALSGGAGASWLSTHPSPRERAERMQQQLAA